MLGFKLSKFSSEEFKMLSLGPKEAEKVSSYIS